MNISSNKPGTPAQVPDKGCEMAPCCLDCPFPACIREDVGGGKRWLKARRDAGISELRQSAEISIAEIGIRFKVSKRTVYRALQKIKMEE